MIKKNGECWSISMSLIQGSFTPATLLCADTNCAKLCCTALHSAEQNSTNQARVPQCLLKIHVVRLHFWVLHFTRLTHVPDETSSKLNAPAKKFSSGVGTNKIWIIFLYTCLCKTRGRLPSIDRLCHAMLSIFVHVRISGWCGPSSIYNSHKPEKKL